jgi:molybdate transport system regulatory protein
MEKKNKIDYKIGGQIWVQKDGKNFMGPGRVSLLEFLSQGKSLEETAQLLNMNVEIALNNINSINKIAKEPLLETTNNENYYVTDYGVEIINTYKKLKQQHETFLEKLNREFEEHI